jgi:hydrogenase expression/formation protein HypE
MAKTESGDARFRAGKEISLAHGEGGRHSRELLSQIFTWLEQPELSEGGDASWIEMESNPQFSFTTDSYVVTPLFFPGGDIGKLAICGTINDLAVSGSRPIALSLSLIIEEGLSIELLERIVRSAAATCLENDVRITCGDTKVVPKGACDGIFINTAGVGKRQILTSGPASMKVGDQILITGPMGGHGLAILASREGLQFSPAPISDLASLWPIVRRLSEFSLSPRAMRDATRGGVAAVCHEWAASCGHSIQLHPDKFPVSDCLRGVAELLGLDPLHIANEGTMLIAVAQQDTERLLDLLRTLPQSENAALIGEVIPSCIAPVLKLDLFGRAQTIDEPLGTPLPRIC